MAGPSPGDRIWDALRTSASAATGAPAERIVQFAGLKIRLRLFGAAADALRPAFAHLEVPDDGDATMTITLWDSATARAPEIPLPPGKPGDDVGASYFWGAGDRRLRWWPATGVVMAHDGDAREAWWWVPDATRAPWGELVAPLRPVLHWWGEAHKLHLLHAGAVGTQDGHGVLLGGRGGSGKSTAAVACLLAGFAYAGDDYVVWDPSGGRLVHSVYATAKLERDAIRRLPALPSTRLGSIVGEKVAVDVNEAFPDRISEALEVRAVLLPTVSPEGAGLIRTNAAEALRLIAPSTVLQRRDAPGSLVRDLTQLLTAVPCYRLLTGPDPRALPPIVDELLATSLPA